MPDLAALCQVTPLQVQDLIARIGTLPPEQCAHILQLIRRLDKAEERERQQTKFLDFVRAVWPQFIAGKHHAKMADAFERIANGTLKRLIIALPPRHALAVDTPIPTPNGFVRIADLKPGDQVYGPDGLPVAVLGVSEVFKNRPVWRVSTDDGASVLADADHLWRVRLCRKYPVFHNKTTEYLVKRTCTRRPMLPNWKPVQYPKRDLPIDPYLLGLWLGDGTSRQATMTAADEDAALYRAELERRGIATTDRSTRCTFGLLKVKVQLASLGLLSNKHIPDIYLRSSIEQRMDLLRGLMDTDGNVSREGQCFFSTTLPALRDGALQLIRSLGKKASYSASRAILNGKDYGVCYKVSFYMKGCATLPRKAERARDHIKKVGRYLSFEPAGVADTVCIVVDRKDGLFLCGDGYIVTHNTKSEFGSYLLPAWYLGRYPDRQIIQATHTAELSVNFGRKVRNLVNSKPFQDIFPGVKLASDSKAAGRWNTNHQGQYFAVGVSGAVAGKGADCLIIDDPVDDQTAIQGQTDPSIYDKLYEWYTTGPRQRLQPNGSIIIIATRWSKRDLTGKVLEAMVERDNADEWETLVFPAIMNEGEENEKALWPQYWPLEELKKIRSNLPPAKWHAQYQQDPTSDEGAIIKREWWRLWKPDYLKEFAPKGYQFTIDRESGRVKPPRCEYIIQSWDTAYTKSTRADYSACITMGVFRFTLETPPCLILLNASEEKMEFPELKVRAAQAYRQWKPDTLIVEAKAAGLDLIYELRRSGIPAQDFTPTRGSDKFVRLNAVADLWRCGMVWAPPTEWAERVIEQMAEFPNGDHDDMLDAAVQCAARFRQGGFIRLPTDEADEKRAPTGSYEYY